MLGKALYIPKVGSLLPSIPIDSLPPLPDPVHGKGAAFGPDALPSVPKVVSLTPKVMYPHPEVKLTSRPSDGSGRKTVISSPQVNLPAPPKLLQEPQFPVLPQLPPHPKLPTVYKKPARSLLSTPQSSLNSQHHPPASSSFPPLPLPPPLTEPLSLSDFPSLPEPPSFILPPSPSLSSPSLPSLSFGTLELLPPAPEAPKDNESDNSNDNNDDKDNCDLINRSTSSIDGSGRNGNGVGLKKVALEFALESQSDAILKVCSKETQEREELSKESSLSLGRSFANLPPAPQFLESHFKLPSVPMSVLSPSPPSRPSPFSSPPPPSSSGGRDLIMAFVGLPSAPSTPTRLDMETFSELPHAPNAPTDIDLGATFTQLPVAPKIPLKSGYV
jgi:hypothetical protein